MKKLFSENSGFTIIEVVIVIVILGILAVVAVPRLSGFIESTKIETTKGEMLNLKEALDGEDGYKVTVGADLFEYDLLYLVERPTTVPPYNIFTEQGWNGPYIIDDGNESYKYDAWNRLYVVTATTITSHGPDPDDTGDDIIIEY
ncbi:prepilin-type N-terminal cleavage/methylation domain-containing protein [candidate division KSB1 bacterium]